MPNQITKFLYQSLLIGGVAMITAAPLSAQDDVLAQQDDAQPAAPATGDSPAGVSIPDSPGAKDLLDKAKEKEDRKQWKAAAEFYQEVLAKYSRRVVASKIDANSNVYQYVGVGQLVQERLAKWPDDGLTAYRTAYGQTAADALASAGRDDLATLDNVFWNWFITDAGKSAGIRLMDLHMEAGQFAAAAWVGERLLTLHPSLGADRAMLLFRTAVAFYWAGDAAKAGAFLDELKLKNPNDTGSIGGKDMVLADALAKVLQLPVLKPATQAATLDSWPSYGGVGGRGEISSSTAKPGAGLNGILLVQPDLSHMQQSPQMPNFQQMEQQDLQSGTLAGIMPVADAGELFFQDGRRVYAVNVDSGLPLSGWLATYGGDHGGRYSIDVFGRARGEQLTLTLTGSRVLAVMGQSDRSGAMYGQGVTSSDRVVCLDRRTGKLIWSRATADLPDAAANLRTAEWNGTPLVVGDDSVLVIARGGKGNQFEDGYVVCLSLATGEYKWSTYVGSASRMFAGDINIASLDSSEMSIADGRVFVLSNLGTIAAIDPYDGRMIWLASYPRDENDNPNFNPMFFRNRMNPNAQAQGTKPWVHNPVMVSNGKVFVLPSDGKDLMVYDAGSGEELKRIVTADYDNIDVLLGIKGNWVVATSENGCFCFDWTKYDHDNPTDAIIWKRDNFDDTMAGGANSIFGRGFVTTDSIFIPTRRRLYEVGFNRSGKLLNIYPAQGAWGTDQGPGNIIATSHNIVVAGSTRVDVYTDLTQVTKRYEKQIAAAPHDPEPRVRFAEVLFAGGQPQAALAKLDEAIDLLGGLNSMRSGKGRDLIFFTALNFAAKQGKVSAGDSVVDELFDRAAAAADSPVQQATYRLERAHFDADNKDYAGVVKLCQQILSDEAMRSAEVSDNSTGGAEAQAAIDDAIHEDRSSYVAVEQQAADALNTAKTTRDAKQLLAVAVVYPNSNAAAQARIAAAGLFESTGDHTAAVDVLWSAYPAIKNPTDRANLLEAMARNFVAMPGKIGAAIDRLALGARSPTQPKLSQPITLPDGAVLTDISFADAVTQLRKLQTKTAASSLADFHIPMPQRHQNRLATAFVSSTAPVIDNVSAIIRPSTEFARNDRVITWSPAGLAIYVPGQSNPQTRVADMTDQPRVAAWVDKQLVVASDNQVWLLNDTGAIAWKSPVHDLPMIAVASADDAVIDEPDPNEAQVIGGVQGGQVIIRGNQRFIVNGGIIRFGGAVQMNAVAVPAIAPAPGEVEQVNALRPSGKRLVVSTSSGRLLGLDMASGQIVWQARLVDKAIDRLDVNSHFTMARLDDAAGSQIVVLDTDTGHIIGRRKFGADNSTNQLVNAALSEEGMLAFTLSNRLLVKDLYEPWKTAPSELTGKANADVMSFIGLTQPNQLMVRNGRVISLYDSGKFARVHELVTSGEAGVPLGTGAESNNAVGLQLAGEQLYINNGKTLWHYNLADPNDHFSTDAYDLDYPPRIRDVFIGKENAILLDDPIDRGPSGSTFVTLLIHSLRPIDAVNNKESGNLDYDVLVKDATGITAWQPVDGGIYYLAGNQKLHFLQGARE
jgi:outer membrane protein assembly factor BamB